jgi:hypothetical protein
MLKKWNKYVSHVEPVGEYMTSPMTNAATKPHETETSQRVSLPKKVSIRLSSISLLLFASIMQTMGQQLPSSRPNTVPYLPIRQGVSADGILFERKSRSVTLGRTEAISFRDTAGVAGLNSTDTTVAALRGRKVIGLKAGTSQIIATQHPSGIKDTLSVTVVPWLADASFLSVDSKLVNCTGLAINGDTVFMQGAGGQFSWTSLYGYNTNTNATWFLHDFPSSVNDPEPVLPTPFGNFVIAKRESSFATRKIYRALSLVNDPQPVGAVFGPENGFESNTTLLQQGWSFDGDGNVYIGEYNVNGAALPNFQAKVYKGSNNGTQFNLAYAFPARSVSGRDGGVRHIHACQVDPYTGDIWIATGDADDASRIYRHTNKLLPDGDGIVRLGLVGIGSQEFRVVSFSFTEKYVYWFMDAPTVAQKIFRVRKRPTYPTLTPENIPGSDYRELVALLPDKPFYNNCVFKSGGEDVILAETVYENAAQYGGAFRELDSCLRIFAIKESVDSLVQVQEVLAVPSLSTFGRLTPLGQDLEGNIIFTTINTEAVGKRAIYKTRLVWQDGQAKAIVPGPSTVVGFPAVDFALNGDVVQGGNASVVFKNVPPPAMVLPAGISRISSFHWDAQAYGLAMLNGRVAIGISRTLALGSTDSLVLLLESTDGERWINIGGQRIGNQLVSTLPVTYLGKIAIGVMPGMVSVEHRGEEIEFPREYGLLQNYPNPFNPTTVVNYELPSISRVRIAVCDLLGRELAVLVDGAKQPGRYQVTFDGSELSSGVYLCRMEAGTSSLASVREFVQTRKLLVIK